MFSILSWENSSNISSSKKYNECLKTNRCLFEGDEENLLSDERWVELMKCKIARAKKCNKDSYEKNIKPNTSK